MAETRNFLATAAAAGARAGVLACGKRRPSEEIRLGVVGICCGARNHHHGFEVQNDAAANRYVLPDRV